MASIPEPDVKNHCAECNEAAFLKCQRCKTVIYCTVTCQSANWSKHRIECNSTALPQVVQRSGDLLKKFVMIWRTDALTEEFSHVEDTGNRLLIHCTNARPDKFYTLPQSILRDQVWTEMVLTADLCTEVIAFFGGIIKQMLKGTDAVIEEATLTLKPPSKMSLIVTQNQNSNRSCKPHSIFQVTSAGLNRVWYLDSTGAQLNIHTTCATADEYMTQYGERVEYLAPLGTSANFYEKMCTLPGLGALKHAQGREGVRAVKKGIEEWSKQTGMKLPALLRLPDEKYAANEKELLDMVRRSVKRFVVLWDCREEVDEQFRRPVSAHLADHELGEAMFKEYEVLCKKYVVKTWDMPIGNE